MLNAQLDSFQQQVMLPVDHQLQIVTSSMMRTQHNVKHVQITTYQQLIEKFVVFQYQAVNFLIIMTKLFVALAVQDTF